MSKRPSEVSHALSVRTEVDLDPVAGTGVGERVGRHGRVQEERRPAVGIRHRRGDVRRPDGQHRTLQGRVDRSSPPIDDSTADRGFRRGGQPDHSSIVAEGGAVVESCAGGALGPGVAT
jgi:hypothetical protein